MTGQAFSVVPRAPGEPRTASRAEPAIWDRLHFATHLRSQRLGEFTIATQLHRSESLALVQLLILYHVVTARAAIALGGGTRSGSVEAPTPVGDGREASVPATAPTA